jgi:hypothetical protein
MHPGTFGDAIALLSGLLLPVAIIGAAAVVDWFSGRSRRRARSAESPPDPPS